MQRIPPAKSVLGCSEVPHTLHCLTAEGLDLKTYLADYWPDFRSPAPSRMPPQDPWRNGTPLMPCTLPPSRYVWAGNPARYLRDVEPEEHGFVESSASNYAELADLHKCCIERSRASRVAGKKWGDAHGWNRAAVHK
eukprot:scaffold225093_cov18-Tisochrysis_lutea.AAC.1